MEENTYVPFYSVFEEVYRHGRTNLKHPVERHTDVCADDLPAARAYAFGLVAERMLIVNKLQSSQVSPSDELEAFRSWDVEVGIEKNTEPTDPTGEPKVEKSTTGDDGKPWDQFNRDDDVVWKVQITTGENYPEDCFLIYNSDDDTDEAVDRFLKEAMFLSEYARANVLSTS